MDGTRQGLEFHDSMGPGTISRRNLHYNVTDNGSKVAGATNIGPTGDIGAVKLPVRFALMRCTERRQTV